jgi:hypothetical protein
VGVKDEGVKRPEPIHSDERGADRLHHRLPSLEFPVPRIRRTLYDDHRPTLATTAWCAHAITGMATQTQH